MLRIARRKFPEKALSGLTKSVCFFSVSYRRTSDEGTKKVVKSSENSDIDGSAKRIVPIPPPPPPLELCCMSGCQNCVMIQHAEELMKFYDDDTAARAAIEEIPDENLKAFLRIELNLK